MHFKVTHETCYRYSSPVRFGPQTLRMLPRLDSLAWCDQELTAEPEPAKRQDRVDAFGNTVTELTFDRPSDILRVSSSFELETLLPGPMPQLPPLPWPPGLVKGSEPYLARAPIDETVRAYAAALAVKSGGSASGFLERLNMSLFEQTDRHIRPKGYARTAADTLELGSGACRDLTVLFMECCRSLGIPARFVSGYQAQSESPDGKRHLHAWPEVCLPDGQWRGFDPTHGQPVIDGHVALCAAPAQEQTMPLEGGFWGESVTSTLEYHVEIEAG
ncbi:transglutaminase family protein [Pseudoruegeria sp. HB172150]|uniref:transglutaminase family protein n=1 Tax=Pseudoruegeria sp. HB172150 TaxID=2721164 RepID=UPI001551A02C|nr:transglutaminase family protein [Pseudoruegeria sp. HB172150]